MLIFLNNTSLRTKSVWFRAPTCVRLSSVERNINLHHGRMTRIVWPEISVFSMVEHDRILPVAFASYAAGHYALDLFPPKKSVSVS